ncbi:glyoxylate/hydroxypyruvate reductase A [Oleispirillum naphthae]|uniref:2-hydroxyacid dehydrogenase n=1 Tax=Oleispirillum naphthae TaxID=2838853 RepID=UPI00308269C4
MSAPRVVCACTGGHGSERWAEDLAAALPEAEVAAWAPGRPPADYAVVWMPPKDFFAAQPRLRAVFNAAAGVDGALAAGVPPGVPLIRLEDAGMGAQMAEYVTWAALSHLREFDVYAAQARAGLWRPRPPRRPADFPVGILGLGVLGRRVAEALRGFGFPLRAWTRSPRGDSAFPVFCGEEGLMPFLAGTRILVCMLPLTDDTRGVIRRDTLAALLPDALCINVARGAHVVEEDLLAALGGGRLAGAVLDVCAEEPLPPGHPFRTHPKIVLTPHVAAATLRGEAVAQIAAKMRAFMRGEAVSGTVDPACGY